MPDDAAYVRLALPAAELRNDTSRVCQVGERCVLVCRSKGQVFAVSSQCSHAEETLEGGKVRNGKVVCPVHGARFDLATGEALAPPATRPIQTFFAREVDGWIEVALA